MFLETLDGPVGKAEVEGGERWGGWESVHRRCDKTSVRFE